jgi:hypothetical protein
MVDKSLNFARAMLTIAVDLYCDVVTVQGRVSITSLHCPADAQVEWQTDDRRVRWHLPQRVIGGSIVDHQHIEIR